MSRVNKRIQVILVTPIGGFIAGPVYAQARLDEVVVTGERIPLDSRAETASRLGLTLRETPATVDVLTEDRTRTASGSVSTPRSRRQ